MQPVLFMETELNFIQAMKLARLEAIVNIHVDYEFILYSHADT